LSKQDILVEKDWNENEIGNENRKKKMPRMTTNNNKTLNLPGCFSRLHTKTPRINMSRLLSLFTKEEIKV
jgi:hypothetical protein